MTTAITGVPQTATPASTLPSRDATVAGPGGAMGKDQFLQLLVTQLKYQDPLNPQDGAAMASQLAQFSSVEQLQNINQALAQQQTQFSGITNAMNNSVALSAIGKMVTAPGNQVTLPDQSPEVTPITANIGAAGHGTLSVLDDSGKVIGTTDLGTVAAGTQNFTIGTAAHGLKGGTYHYQLTVTGANGTAVTTTPYMTVRVDGVSYSASGAVLTAGSLSIPVGSVIRIQG